MAKFSYLLRSNPGGYRTMSPEQMQTMKKCMEWKVCLGKNSQDDQLRLLFSCCQPQLSVEAQVTLILKTLCGFSVAEIAHALLANAKSIEKRLALARNLFRQSAMPLEPASDSDLRERLEAVYQAIYLLFSEGYHGSQSKQIVREELCFEAIRLALLLSEHPQGAKPQTHALLALLCFHTARLPGRVEHGALIQLDIQDRSKWDRDLIGKGFHFLERSSAGDEMSAYHLEAAIASVHCAAVTYEQTDWNRILELYDLLYTLKPSPIVALNRAVDAGMARGAEAGLAQLRMIADVDRLEDFAFYPAAQGEFHLMAGMLGQAESYFELAKKRARSPSEVRFFERKLKACRQAN